MNVGPAWHDYEVTVVIAEPLIFAAKQGTNPNFFITLNNANQLLSRLVAIVLYRKMSEMDKNLYHGCRKWWTWKIPPRSLLGRGVLNVNPPK